MKSVALARSLHTLMMFGAAMVVLTAAKVFLSILTPENLIG